MPVAAILTRASRSFGICLSRVSARKGNSGSGPCPLTMLRHLANLQAPNTLRQGIPFLGIGRVHRYPLAELKCVSPKRRQEMTARLGGEPGGARTASKR